VTPTWLLAAVLAGAAAPVTFQYGDWDLACDNTGTCRAAGYQANDHDWDGPVSVLLTREAGPARPVAVELQLGEVDPRPAAVHLLIDRRDLGEIRLSDGRGRFSPPQVEALLAALRRDTAIAFLVGADGWFLSDAGASAVLLKMDEAQGRLGTPGALVRKGTRPESSVPAAIPAPVVVPAPVAPPRAGDAKLGADPALRRALQAAVAQAGECDPFDASDAEREVTVARLDDHELLVSTTCWTAAYNGGTGYWVVDAAPPHAAVLVTTDGSDYADGEIRADQKGRGIGDCWYHERWRWDGHAFVRTHRQEGLSCKGFLGGAWDQPVYVTAGTP
jgi:hypothetical protein